MQYHVNNQGISWKKLFTDLNELKIKFDFMESFTASSVTLEDIFKHFTKDDLEMSEAMVPADLMGERFSYSYG